MSRIHSEIVKRIGKLCEKPVEFPTAYDAGFDAGKNGPNTVNCSFRWFASRESSDQWSKGYKKAGGK